MSARETILDAAARVMREKGLARATTKEIARTAGYSEALLYKYFADKQEIYLAVLHERAGGLTDARELVGTAEVRGNLEGLVVRLMEFYVKSFPMSASIFSDRELLAHWRESIQAKGHDAIIETAWTAATSSTWRCCFPLGASRRRRWPRQSVPTAHRSRRTWPRLPTTCSAGQAAFDSAC